jgi:hypothetical protein
VPSPCGLLQDQRDHDVEDQHHEHAHRDVHPCDVEGLARPGEQVGHLAAAHRGTARVEQGERDEDVQRAEGHDEGRQLESRHEEAVEGAGCEPDDEAEEQAEHRGQPRLHGGLRDHHRAQHHDGADREVDARCEDDERLGDRERAHDGDLLCDERQVRRVPEAVVQ